MSKDKSAPTPEPEKFDRWTAQRKAAIILEILKGHISVPEASRKYGFTQGEYRKWAEDYHRGGVEALKTNRKDQEAKYRGYNNERPHSSLGYLTPVARRAKAQAPNKRTNCLETAGSFHPLHVTSTRTSRTCDYGFAIIQLRANFQRGRTPYTRRPLCRAYNRTYTMLYSSTKSANKGTLWRLRPL